MSVSSLFIPGISALITSSCSPVLKISTGGIHAPPNSRNGSQRTIAILLSLLCYAPTTSPSTTSPSLTSCSAGPPCEPASSCPAGGVCDCLYICSAIACDCCCSASVALPILPASS